MKKTDFQKVDKHKYKESRKFFEMRASDLKAIASSNKMPDSDLAEKELKRRAQKRKRKDKKKI